MPATTPSTNKSSHILVLNNISSTTTLIITQATCPFCQHHHLLDSDIIANNRATRDFSQKKSILLTKEFPGYKEIEKKTTGCVFTNLVQHLEIMVLLYFDYKTECYEIPFPTQDYIDEVLGKFQQSWGK